MSYVQFFESSWKERFNSVSHVQNRVNHWVLLLKKGLKMKKKSNPLSYIGKKRFNSLGHVKQKVQSIESIFEKGSILRVRFSFKNFNSQSHIFQERSIHSLSHTFCKKEENLWVIKKWVIFFDSCWKEGFNLNESYCSKKAQFCESC